MASLKTSAQHRAKINGVAASTMRLAYGSVMAAWHGGSGRHRRHRQALCVTLAKISQHGSLAAKANAAAANAGVKKKNKRSRAISDVTAAAA